MEQNDFNIKRNNNTIILEKNNQKFEIFQTTDDDLWFSTLQEEMSMELSLYSRNYSECQTYLVFENLITSIIGRYILNKDIKKEYSRLPKDFIDLEDIVIIWHSDSNTDNILKFEYPDTRLIKISISKCKDSKDYHNNSVRIRTSGSSYECYYQEFLEFFKHLLMLENRLNQPIENVQSKEQNTESKKLSLFKKIYNKK